MQGRSKRLAVVTAFAMVLSFGIGGAVASPPDKGSKGKGDSATMTGDFNNGCTEFEGGSDKDISNIEVFYADGTSEKYEYNGNNNNNVSAGDGRQIDYVVVKSGNKSQRFDCPECQDRKDNDGDGGIDYDKNGDGVRDADSDPDCESEDDPSESPTPECSDGRDNADPEDTVADEDDPGCLSGPGGSYNPDDPDETDPNGNNPECSDGRDNADPEDTVADEDDPGCLSGPGGSYNPDDPDETDPTGPRPECSDDVDNADAEDTLADENDPGCLSGPGGTYDPNDPSEVDPTTAPECSDDVDNADVEDTLADENDPGCLSGPGGTYDPNDPSEVDPTTAPECSDDRDNADPEDILVDENDPGCLSGPGGTYDPNDPSEVDPTTGGNFTCRASALRIEDNVILQTLLAEEGDPFEPVIANGPNDPCAADDAELIDEELAGAPGSLAVTVLTAETTENTAESGAASVTIRDAAGEVVLSAEALQSEASADCVNGQPVLTGSSEVASVTLPDGTVITVTDGEEFSQDLGPLGTLHVNYQDQRPTADGTGTELVQRAIFLDTDTPLGDVIIAESIVDVHGDPCP